MDIKKLYNETVIAECCRWLGGAVFVFSGFVKAVDPVGGAIKIDEYLAAFGLEQFQLLSLFFSINLCAIEFMLGVCLLLGAYRKYATLLALLFMAFMTPLTLYLAFFDPVSDCGCFGDALVLTNWQTFGKNIILSAAILFLYTRNGKIFPFYTPRAHWFIALFSYAACGSFAYHNYNHLPPIDFRPYKVGANIPGLMSIPEGAPEDEYLYSFVYEKNGRRKTFSLENIPAEDSSWVFVDSKTKLLKQGYVPPVAAFNLYDGDEDIAGRILDNPEGVFLLIAPQLEKADDEHVDKINSVYDYTSEKKLAFYAVTASPQEAITRWSDYTGAEYPFLQADDVLLKTIIRSNPGLLLLKGGTILAKWHYHDIPAEEGMTEVMDALLQGEKIRDKEGGFPVTNLFIFTIPLLLVWGYDYIRHRRKPKDSD
jgi:uncharacterized membrane protein YphA (DoxX/SURF4 family)